jgi:hypothetical protein
MGKTRRIGVVTAAVAALAAFTAAPASAADLWVPCDTPAIGPLCDAAGRQVGHVLTEAEAATDYVLFWGDAAIATVNDAYATVRCDVLGECG